MAEYRDFLGDTLARMSDIKQTHTYVVMEEVKATHSLAV
jgi:Lrp/AsnC family leucine-responsive transcriptional regulator